MTEWGNCLNCGCTSKEPYCQNCDGDLEGKCQECGKAFEEDVDACLYHIDGYEDLEKYARGLVECRDKLIGENRELRKMVERGSEREKSLGESCERLITLNNQFLADSLGIKQRGNRNESRRSVKRE